MAINIEPVNMFVLKQFNTVSFDSCIYFFAKLYYVTTLFVWFCVCEMGKFSRRHQTACVVLMLSFSTRFPKSAVKLPRGVHECLKRWIQSLDKFRGIVPDDSSRRSSPEMRFCVFVV